MFHDHPTGQEIRPSTAQLSSAGSRKEKTEPVGEFIGHGLDFIEKSGNPLHFIDQNKTVCPRYGTQFI